MNRMMKKRPKLVTKTQSGSRILPGGGIRQNYAEVFNQYCKLAERGNAGGQFELGMMFFYGQGVPQSDQEAVLWLRKAAEQGHTGAKAALVLCMRHTTVNSLRLKVVGVRQKARETGGAYLQCVGI